MRMQDWAKTKNLLAVLEDRIDDIDSAEICRDNNVVREELTRVALMVTESCKEQIEKGERCSVVVGVRVNPVDKMFLYPHYTDSEESRTVFSRAQKELRKFKAVGAVNAFDGGYEPAGGEEVDALIVCILSRPWRRIYIHPYTVQEGGVQWMPTVERTHFTNQISMFDAD